MSGLAKNPNGEDWRKARPGSTKKLGYILENKNFTDVTFLVGVAPNVDTICAHRLVLTMHSSVFEAMLQGPLASGAEEIIAIPDIYPQAFHFLLKFIYTSEFEKDLSTENAISVLYAAKKYDVMDLELVCTNYIKSLINSCNAISIFQTAQLLDNNDLKTEAHGFISRHFDEICRIEEFVQETTLDTLTLFLEDDSTRCSELGLFHTVLRWAEAECIRQNLVPSPANCRKVAEPAIMLIRYPTIPPEEFALKVVRSGVLTYEESTRLFQHMVVPIENRHLLPELQFNVKRRNCSIYIAKFYDGMAKTEYVDISAGWFNKFSVDQPVSIVSFGFYGPYNAELGSYQVTIKLMTDASEVLSEVTEKSVIAKMQKIFHVKFPKPVEVYPGFNYRAWFSIKGPLTCHGSTSLPGRDVLVPVRFSKFSHVKFSYNITGAHQLPEIAFQI